MLIFSLLHGNHPTLKLRTYWSFHFIQSFNYKIHNPYTNCRAQMWACRLLCPCVQRSLESVQSEEEADFSPCLWKTAAVEPLVSQNTERVPWGSLTGDEALCQARTAQKLLSRSPLLLGWTLWGSLSLQWGKHYLTAKTHDFINHCDLSSYYNASLYQNGTGMWEWNIV